MTEVTYTIFSTVVNVEQHFKRQHVSGIGADAVFESHSLGWYVHLAGSWEALYLGEEKPEFVTGDKVRISITKEPIC